MCTNLSLLISRTVLLNTFIHSLDADEIQQLDDDLKANGYGEKSLLEIENAL